MKKILASVVALVSLLSSIAITTNANYTSFLSELNDIHKLPVFEEGFIHKSCFESCSDNFKECLKTPLFVTTEGLEIQYDKCVNSFDSCLKSKCSYSYKEDNEIRAFIGDFCVNVLKIC